jgi:hypothetical protein
MINIGRGWRVGRKFQDKEWKKLERMIFTWDSRRRISFDNQIKEIAPKKRRANSTTKVTKPKPIRRWRF